MKECVVCGKRITYPFKVCAECEAVWGNRVGNRPEWLTFLVNEEERNRWHDKHHKFISIADSDDGFYYEIDFENLIQERMNYAGFLVDDSDGLFELQDSDWEAVYTWSL
jgi:hypothetical protein